MATAIRNASSHSFNDGGPASSEHHLRNHLHLTNCIHLRNHVHRRCPAVSGSSLARDLLLLQRSRSLRDPSTSPPSWLFSSVKKPRRDGLAHSARRSLCVDRSPRVSRVEVEQGIEVPSQTACAKSSEKLAQSGRSHCNGFARKKQRRFKSSRRARGPIETRVVGAHSNPSVASNSIAQGSVHQKCCPIKDSSVAFTEAPRNGCGMHWNWSRIHHKGRTILDIAGRSLSCGLSDSRIRRAEGVKSIMPITSDHISSSTESESEALPLLIDPAGSQESNGCSLTWDYLGEINIFGNRRPRHGKDSELASEAGNCDRVIGYRRGRHRTLTQKYMPRTFKDIVGQNLVVQALSNAILRRKISLIYVFYGPHGTGKTSCARVFAKALNCQSMEQPKPCDVCDTCISYNRGNTDNVVEVGTVGYFDLEGIVDVLDDMMLSPVSPQYRVFIVDGCDTLSSDSWSAVLKVIDRAPQRMVFVFISTKLDLFPHIMISRCQRFFFPKLKEYDIICALEWIATSEGLEIEKDALKLIATRSDGSLRDAEMTLDQLSLLGGEISLPLVQELVGLVSDEKLVDLLDLALSADTVNTVKSLRHILEDGVEPLALMSQLATIITDILSGNYIFIQERVQRKFFRQQALSKEDMRKLRQALKTLSEAEKQLRMSNDKSTWLTAAMLQLAPDQQYLLPSSTEGSLNYSPLRLQNSSNGDVPNGRGLSRGRGHKNFNDKSTTDVGHGDGKMFNGHFGKKKHVERNQELSAEVTRGREKNSFDRNLKDTEQIWQAVLGNIQSDALKQFMNQEGKLISVSLGAAPTVQLMFTSHVSKSKAEKFRGQILHAFKLVLDSAVILEIRCKSRKKDVRTDNHACGDDSSLMAVKQKSILNQGSLGSADDRCIRRDPKESLTEVNGPTKAKGFYTDLAKLKKLDIGEAIGSFKEQGCIYLTENTPELKQKGSGSGWLEEASPSKQQTTLVPLSERKEVAQPSRRKSLARSKVSLAYFIQKAEVCAQRGGWSRRKAVSIAEKLEQENLKLEPRSRSLLCWRASRVPRGKPPRWKIRTQRPRSLLKLVTCGKCVSANSPR